MSLATCDQFYEPMLLYTCRLRINSNTSRTGSRCKHSVATAKGYSDIGTIPYAVWAPTVSEKEKHTNLLQKLYYTIILPIDKEDTPTCTQMYTETKMGVTVSEVCNLYLAL